MLLASMLRGAVLVRRHIERHGFWTLSLRGPGGMS